ncbi:MAG: addiction module protein [Gammaproteobacteria bacterium RIFCSPLOWO2_02_FULL_56_15]|nr:MAG: addiction module protein [Gammaproteobacteria bacterium RIFCSPLOWO2_02_FULL_56_15]
MYTVLRSKEFDEWLADLKDRIGKARILARLISVEQGNFGDAHSVGDGISELRIHSGPGYRVYYTSKGKILVYVLCGGDKSSQKRDIAKAKVIAASIEE